TRARQTAEPLRAGRRRFLEGTNRAARSLAPRVCGLERPLAAASRRLNSVRNSRHEGHEARLGLVLPDLEALVVLEAFEGLRAFVPSLLVVECAWLHALL